MIIVGELTETPHEQRKKFWLEKLALPFQWKDWTEQELQDPSFILKNPPPVHGVLISNYYSDLLFRTAQKKPAEVIEVGLADSLIVQQKTGWLRCFLRIALRQLIMEKAPSLNTHASCYITGSGSITRLCSVVAIQMGFRHLVFVSADHHEAAAEIRALSRLFFDLDLKLLKESELTLQPNNGSLLMNTVNAENGGMIYEDLTYLNFLEKEGLVVDLSMSAEGPNPLLEETENAGLKSLKNHEICGVRDWLFLQSLLAEQDEKHLKHSLSEYMSEWEAFLNPTKSENQT